MEVDKIDVIESFKGRTLRAKDSQREQLVKLLDPRDIRGRSRKWTTAKRMIGELGYEIRESNDSGGRYARILATERTRLRYQYRQLIKTGLDPDDFYRRQAEMLIQEYRKYHPLKN